MNTVAPEYSVVIATRNRLQDVTDAVDSVCSQSGPPAQVIVVDDGSDQQNAERLRQELEKRPNVRLIHTAGPVGACAARNLGARQARGEWLVFLDDDVVFADAGGFEIMRSVTAQHPEVSALGFRLIDYRTGQLCNWMYNRPANMQHQKFYANKFPAGAGSVRRQAFLDLGGFPERFGYYGEEAVVGLRLLDRGHRILYVPEVTLRHKVSKVARVPGRRLYYDVRNNIWLAVLLLPMPRMIRHVVSVVVRQLFSSSLSGNLLHYLRGLRDGMIAVPELLAERRPVQSSTVRIGF